MKNKKRRERNKKKLYRDYFFLLIQNVKDNNFLDFNKNFNINKN